MYLALKKNWNKAKQLILIGFAIIFLLLLAVVYKNDDKITKKSELIKSQNETTDLKIFKEFILNQINSPFINLNYEIKKAPGAFEVPYLINQYKNSYDAFLAFGCIIRGETYHFEIISNEVTRKIMDLSIDIGKPIGFGILTCENLEQAMERSDPSKKNKGAESQID